MMKEIKSLELHLENCETVVVDRKYIGMFLLDEYNKYFNRCALNSISGGESFNKLILQIHPDLDKTEQDNLFQFDDEPKRLPIKRLHEHNDITQITINFEDGTNEHYFITWSEESEWNNEYQKSHINKHTGELFIVVDKDNTIEDYFKWEIENKDFEMTMWGLWEEDEE